MRRWRARARRWWQHKRHPSSVAFRDSLCLLLDAVTGERAWRDRAAALDEPARIEGLACLARWLMTNMAGRLGVGRAVLEQRLAQDLARQIEDDDEDELDLLAVFIRYVVGWAYTPLLPTPDHRRTVAALYGFVSGLTQLSALLSGRDVDAEERHLIRQLCSIIEILESSNA